MNFDVPSHDALLMIPVVQDLGAIIVRCNYNRIFHLYQSFQRHQIGQEFFSNPYHEWLVFEFFHSYNIILLLSFINAP